MSWALNNVTSENAYSEKTTLETGLAKRASISVFNASILYQVLTEPERGMKGLAIWQPEVFLAPGSLSIGRRGLYGIRFRSAVAGKPAQVTVELLAIRD